LLELFAAMGTTASFQALQRSIDFAGADPLTMTFTVLGRWPTHEEAAAFRSPYPAWQHMHALLRSDEFRALLPRRTCEAFPERKRILFVRMPRSAGAHVIATLDGKHPMLPLDLAHGRYRDPTLLAQTLGHVFARMNNSNALAMVQDSMAAFVDEPQNQLTGPDPLAWHAGPPPCRSGDVLFAIIRDPAERAMSQVNATLRALRGGQDVAPALIARLGDRLEQDRAAMSPAKWRDIGRVLLAARLARNPVCHALGDGTAEGALRACARAPVTLVPPSGYRIWGRSTLDTIPPDPAPPEPALLRAEDLTQPDRDHIAAATQEDRLVFDRLMARLKLTELPAAPGRELS
jgi:hypothetical protein